MTVRAEDPILPAKGYGAASALDDAFYNEVQAPNEGGGKFNLKLINGHWMFQWVDDKGILQYAPVAIPDQSEMEPDD